MKLGVAAPDAARRRHAARRTTAIEELPDGGAADRRRGAQQRPRRRPARARRATRCSPRRCWPGASGQLRNLATVGGNLLQRTRCAYFQDVTKPCNKREPGIGLPGARRAHHRDLAILGHSRALRRHAPVGHGGRAGRARRASSTSQGPRRRARRSRSPSCTGCPATSPQRDTVLAPGELITAVELPPLPFAARSRYRKVRDRASYAFALVSVAAALDVADGVVRDVRIALGGVAHKPWRAHARRGGAARRAGRPRQPSRRAADAELAAARPLPRQRLQGPARAQRCIVRDARRELRGGAMSTVADPRRSARPLDPRRRAARRSPARARYAFEHPVDGRRLRVAGPGARSPRGRITRRRRRRGARRARRARGALARATRRGWPRRRRRARRPAVRRRSPTAARSSPPSSPRRSEAARDAAGARARRRTTQRAARRVLRADHPRLYAPGHGQRRLRRPTREQGDVDAALAAAAVTRRRDLHDARRSTTTRWSRTPRSRVWDGDGLDALRLQPGRARRRADAGRRGLRAASRERVRVISPARRRRLRLEGHRRARTLVLAAMAARVVGPAGEARAHPAADVRRSPATARRRSSGSGSAPTPTAGSPRSPTTSSSRPPRSRSSPSRPRSPTRMMYAAPNRRTTHRLARARRADAVVDARAGRVPGHVRARVGDGRAGASPAASTRSSCGSATSPTIDPETRPAVLSRATSSRACARAPSASAGSAATRARARAATGAGSSAPASPRRPTRPAAARRQRARSARERRRRATSSRIDAADIGTGARTVLTQIAADALDVPVDARRRATIGDSDLPPRRVRRRLDRAPRRWGSAVVKACRAAARREPSTAARPARGARGRRPTRRTTSRRGALSRARLRRAVRRGAGATPTPARCGCRACSASSPSGRIINPRTARSQLIGGMTMGLSMALHEESVHRPARSATRQPRPRRVPRRRQRRRRATIEAHWLDEHDAAPQPDGRQGHRRDRHRRHRRGDRQRRPPRHRRARARPADHARQAAGRRLSPARAGRIRRCAGFKFRRSRRCPGARCPVLSRSPAAPSAGSPCPLWVGVSGARRPRRAAVPRGPAERRSGVQPARRLLRGRRRWSAPPGTARAGRFAWYLVALGQVLFVRGRRARLQLRAPLRRELPFPSVADPLYLAMYPCLAFGLLTARAPARIPTRDRAGADRRRSSSRSASGRCRGPT